MTFEEEAHMGLPIQKKASIRTERLELKPFSPADRERMRPNSMTEEIEYRGAVHRCGYCEISFEA